MPTAIAIRHVAFEDIGTLAAPLAQRGFNLGYRDAAIDDLANNEGIFVNKSTFKVVRGMAKGDPAAQIAKLGARPATEGAIIFRSADKLYIVDAVPGGGQMYLQFQGAFAPPG